MQQEALVLMMISIMIMFGGLLVQRSKLYYCLQVFLLILLAGLNTYSQDFDINERLYYSGGGINDISLSPNIAYNFLVSVFKVNGADFITYNCCISAISILLISYVIKRDCRNYNVAILLVYLYPFAEMIIQKRFLPAMAVMLFATKYLHERKISSDLKYIACLLLAFSLHTSMLFYIVFFVLSKVYTKDEKKRSIVIAALFFMELVGVRFIPTLLGFFYPADKVELYFITFAESSSLFKFVCWTTAHLTFVGLIYYVYHHTNKNRLSKFVYDINIFSLLIIPLYNFDPVFMRLFRIVAIYNYIYLCNFMPQSLLVQKTNIVASLGIVILAGIYFYIWYIAGIGNMTFERMILPIYDSNLLVD